MYFALIVITLTIAIPAKSLFIKENFAPNHHERHRIESCLSGGHVGPIFTDQCVLLRDMAQQMADNSILNRDRRICQLFLSKGESRNLDMEYINKLGAMKSTFQEPEDSLAAMLDTIAPCSFFSSSIKQKWDRFFKERGGKHDNEIVSLRPTTQKVRGDRAIVTFTLPKKRSNFSLHQPIGADLALLRTPPCQLDESFGMYDVTVRKIPNNVSEPEVILHRSTQSTCASTGGYMLVVGLDLQPSMDWFLHGEEPLQLSVVVRPIRQILSGNVSSNDSSLRQVLRRVMSLHFQMRIGSQAQRQFPGRLLQERAMRRHGWGSRTKRSASRGIRGCEKVSYRLHQFQDFVFPILPDVGECLGRCDFPIHMPTNASNHAVALNVERTFNPRRPGIQPTVDCVPTSYYSMFASWIGDDKSESGYLDDFVVQHCGCA